jgi:preprotein translocase subunit SecG
MAILSLNFWFGYYPMSAGKLAVIALFFLAAAIIFALMAKHRSVYSGLERRVSSTAAYNCAIAAAFSFFNYEQTSLMCNRFWYGLWVVEVLVLAIAILRKLGPAKEAQSKQQKEKELKKYLPR